MKPLLRSERNNIYYETDFFVVNEIIKPKYYFLFLSFDSVGLALDVPKSILNVIVIK